MRMNKNGARQGAEDRNGEGKGERMLGGKRPMHGNQRSKQNGNLFVRRCAYMSAFPPLHNAHTTIVIG
jgi:hypothetical protein